MTSKTVIATPSRRIVAPNVRRRPKAEMIRMAQGMIIGYVKFFTVRIRPLMWAIEEFSIYAQESAGNVHFLRWDPHEQGAHLAGLDGGTIPANIG